jgi:hypothetical protein
MKKEYIIHFILAAILLTSCVKDELADFESLVHPVLSTTGIVYNGILHTPIANSSLYHNDSILTVNNFSTGGVAIHLDENCIWATAIDNYLSSGEKLILKADTNFLIEFSSAGEIKQATSLAGFNNISLYKNGEMIYSYLHQGQNAPVLTFYKDIRTIVWSVSDLEENGVYFKSETIAAGFRLPTSITLPNNDFVEADLITFNKTSDAEGYLQPNHLQLTGENIEQLQIYNAIASASACGRIFEIEQDVKN